MTDRYTSIEEKAKAATAERFFIDHGMIHDRVSGRHVTTAPDDEIWMGMTITETCALLNSIHTNGILHCLTILQKEIDGAEEALSVPNLTEAARREAKCWHDGVFFAAKTIRETLPTNDIAADLRAAEARIEELRGALTSCDSTLQLCSERIATDRIAMEAIVKAIKMPVTEELQKARDSQDALDRYTFAAIDESRAAARSAWKGKP